MAQLRRRHLESLLKKSLKFSPITAVFGHRQVGKTTLVSELAQRYTTLDQRPVLELSQSDPSVFLREHAASPLVVDECQLSPPLFPAMKEWVRTNPRPGQLLLTGSVRFTSRKAIRESLTGRLVSWDLLPMDLSECHEAPLPDTLSRILRARDAELELQRASYYSDREFDRYLRQGGLPGVFAVRDAAIQLQRFETQIEAALERDLKLVLQTSLSFRSLRTLLKELAMLQGEPLEWAALARKTRISAATLRKLIQGFEAMYLIRIIETRGNEKKPVVFFEDQGEASHLSEGARNELWDLTRFLFAQLRVQAAYRPEQKIRVFQFRNRGGAWVPLCFEGESGIVGFIPSLTEEPGPSALATARAFTLAYPKAKVFCFHRGDSDCQISSAIRSIGVGSLV